MSIVLTQENKGKNHCERFLRSNLSKIFPFLQIACLFGRQALSQNTGFAKTKVWLNKIYKQDEKSY